MRQRMEVLFLGAALLGTAAHGAQPAVTFDDAVKQALARNPTVAQAQAQIERAQALVTQSRAAYLPTVTGNAVYTQLDHDRESGGRVVTPASGFNANVTFAVPLVVPQRWLATQRAREGVEVSRASAADLRRAVAANVASAYLAVVLQRRLLETNTQARDTAKAHVEFSRARLNQGLGNRLDLVRSERELHDNEARVQLAVASLARAQEALGVAMGLDSAMDATDTPELAGVPTVQDALKTVDRREDVAAQRSRLKLAERTLRDSWADYMPSLTAVGQPFFQAPETPTIPQWGFQAQVLLSVPLYDGGFRYGAKRERAANVADAKASLEGLTQRARGEVRSAAEQLEGAQAASTEQEASASAARQTLELATLAYRTGTLTSLDVTDAERGARDAETNALLAQDSVRQARLNLLLASGQFPANTVQ